MRVFVIICSCVLFLNALNCSSVSAVKEYNGHYYTITSEKMTFLEAKQFAEDNDGYLAIPNNSDENNFLKSLIPTPKYAWIGVYDPDYMTNYCYGTDKCSFDDSRFVDIKGNALSYTNWAEYQPDNLVKGYDIVNGKEIVTPLGEHWVAISSLDGKWADFGNHADEYNNPIKYYALIEFDKMPDCYTSPSDVTDTYSGAKCNTQIWDKETGDVSQGDTYTCLQDKYNTYYCPTALSECGEEWDYEDGYSITKTAVKYETYDKIRVWVGKIGDNYWCASCSLYHLTTYFNVQDINKVTEFYLRRTKFDDWIKVELNGHLLRVGPYGGDRLEKKTDGCGSSIYYTATKSGSCELSTSWDQWLKINAKPYLVNGTNKVDIYVYVAGCGEGYAYFEGIAGKGDVSCTTSYCSMQDIGDIDVPITYTYYEYLCNSDPNEYNEDYQPIVQTGDSPTPPPNNCKREKFVCKEAPDRQCAWVDDKWQCSPFPCFGEGAGDYNVTDTDTPVGINDKENDGWNDDGSCSGKIYIFNGKDNRCRSDDAFFGLTGGGCCDKDKVFMGIVKCKEDEKLLAKKRDKKQCHYIGEYCSKELNLIFTKICIQHKQTYCCFNSLLARLINEQGRPQIKKGWGSAESPDCSGFTPEQFQKLDFSKLDLSEFYDQITQNVTQSFADNMNTYIQNSVTNQLENMTNQ